MDSPVVSIKRSYQARTCGQPCFLQILDEGLTCWCCVFLECGCKASWRSLKIECYDCNGIVVTVVKHLPVRVNVHMLSMVLCV